MGIFSGLFRSRDKPHIAPAEAHCEEMLTQLIEEALS